MQNLSENSLHPDLSNDVVRIPENLSEEETIQFIRNAILERGGNPDTAYPLFTGDGEPELPNVFSITLNYEHYEPQVDPKAVCVVLEADEAWDKNRDAWFRGLEENQKLPAKKGVTMDYQSGFGSFGG